jgi:hypothetical protein
MERGPYRSVFRHVRGLPASILEFQSTHPRGAFSLNLIPDLQKLMATARRNDITRLAQTFSALARIWKGLSIGIFDRDAPLLERPQIDTFNHAAFPLMISPLVRPR